MCSFKHSQKQSISFIFIGRFYIINLLKFHINVLNFMSYIRSLLTSLVKSHIHWCWFDEMKCLLLSVFYHYLNINISQLWDLSKAIEADLLIFIIRFKWLGLTFVPNKRFNDNKNTHFLLCLTLNWCFPSYDIHFTNFSAFFISILYVSHFTFTYKSHSFSFFIIKANVNAWLNFLLSKIFEADMQKL